MNPSKSSLPKGDFNMPPGVRVTDIPGNRPGDDDESCPDCEEEGSYFDAEFETIKTCRRCGGLGVINTRSDIGRQRTD